MKKLISLNNVDVSSRALLNGVIMSPRKINEVARAIQKRYVDDAKRILFCAKRKASEMIHKLLLSAVANSKVEDKSSLVVMEVSVGRGPIMRKVIFCGRGRRGIEKKKMSNIKVVLGTISEEAKQTIVTKKIKKGGE